MKSCFAYPGNKQNIINSVERKGWLFIDQFVGAGSFLLKQYKDNPNGSFIIADADLPIRCFYDVCNRDPDSVVASATEWRNRFDKKPEETWNHCIEVLERCNTSTSHIAGAKLLFQRVAHGSVARTRTDGKTYNVKWSVDKSIGIGKWNPKVPDLRECDLIIENDYKKCYEITDVDYSQAIVFSDPPYYAPFKSACYPGHDPGSLKTLLMVFNSVELPMSKGVKEIIFTHYYLEGIDERIDSYCHEYGYISERFIGEELRSLAYGRGNYKHGQRIMHKGVYKDCLWKLTRNS